MKQQSELNQEGVLTLRHCPVCNSEKAKIIRSVDKWKEKQDVAKCEVCGFVYVSNGFYYTYDYDSGLFPESPKIRKRHLHIKRLLDQFDLPHHGHKISIAEVGAGAGGLAKTITADSKYDYLGFEPNAKRAEYCKSKGLNVTAEYFSASKFKEQISGVIFDNVLEHVENPVDLIRQGVEVLLPGGIMIIIVPNLKDVRQLNPHWRDNRHWITHIHINYFTSRDLQKMMQDCGISFNFFDSASLSLPNDWPFLLRNTMDSFGLHLFGLNCYGFKQ